MTALGAILAVLEVLLTALGWSCGHNLLGRGCGCRCGLLGRSYCHFLSCNRRCSLLHWCGRHLRCCLRLRCCPRGFSAGGALRSGANSAMVHVRYHVPTAMVSVATQPWETFPWRARLAPALDGSSAVRASPATDTTSRASDAGSGCQIRRRTVFDCAQASAPVQGTDERRQLRNKSVDAQPWGTHRVVGR